MFTSAVACTGKNGAVIKAQQEKPVVTHGKHKGKAGSSPDCIPDNVAVENNNLAVPAPSLIPVPGVPVGPGDKVVKEANGNIASGLDSMLNGIGDALDKATECSFGRVCSSDSDSDNETNPNLGKDLTDDQKNEIGGTDIWILPNEY